MGNIGEHISFGFVTLALGVGVLVSTLNAQEAASAAVREATPHPAVLTRVAELQCNTSNKRTKCDFGASARLTANEGARELPVFTGSFTNHADGSEAHAAHVIGAPTTLYELPKPDKAERRYYTPVAFEQLREESTWLGNFASFAGSAIFFLLSAGNFLLNLLTMLERRSSYSSY